MAPLYHFLCPGAGLSYGAGMSDELATLDATAQAELVRRGKLSPSALVDAAIARVEAVNPKLNAVIIPLFEKARAQAASPNLPRGPFRGVPFLLKDLLAYSADDPHHMGTRLLKRLGFVAPHDSNTAARLRAAGFVFLGKTNTPELGTLPTTEPDAYGPTRNPWDPSRSTGGSSGGSAAAVAAGLVPAAHANDGGGSIRIPASECGVVGLKPSRARISFGPDLGEPLAGLAHEGVVTRSVRDTAALLDVLAGYEPGDPHTAPPPRRLVGVGLRPPAHTHAPPATAAARHLHALARGSGRSRHAGGAVRRLHLAVQHDGPARHLVASRVERRGVADRHPAGSRVRARGSADPRRRAARAGAAMGRAPAADSPLSGAADGSVPHDGDGLRQRHRAGGVRRRPHRDRPPARGGPEERRRARPRQRGPCPLPRSPAARARELRRVRRGGDHGPLRAQPPRRHAPLGEARLRARRRPPGRRRALQPAVRRDDPERRHRRARP